MVTVLVAAPGPPVGPVITGGVVALGALTLVGGVLKMSLKRVDLLNCDAALPAVQLFI